MIDLGKDVDPEAVVEAAIENDVRLVGPLYFTANAASPKVS